MAKRFQDFYIISLNYTCCWTGLKQNAAGQIQQIYCYNY